MAVIQFTGLVSEIQGKLNGSVLSKGRNGRVIYNRPTQRKEPTAAQLRIRAGFSAASYYWQDLTPEQKLDWDQIAENNPVPDRFGNPTVLSGFDYFKRMMQLTFPEGTSAGIIPDLTGDAVYEHTPISAEANFSITDQGFQIDAFEVIFETINDSPAPNLVNLYISLPVRDNSRPYFKTWYLVKQFEIAANLGASEQVILDGEDILMPSGWRTFDGTPQLFKTIAFIPSQGRVSVEQIYPFIMSGQPPVVFPLFSWAAEGEAINVEGSAGIFDYFWLTSQKAAILADFSFQTQWAPPQETQSPPDESDFFPIVNSGASSAGPSNIIIPTVPGGPNGWYDPWYADVSSLLNPMTSFWAPVRARLVHIPTGQTGEWVLGYWTIFFL